MSSQVTSCNRNMQSPKYKVQYQVRVPILTRGEYRSQKPYRDILRYGDSVLQYVLNMYWISNIQHLNQRTNGPVKRSPDIWAKHKIKFGSKWSNHFWEKPVLIFKCKWPRAKVKKWPRPSILTYLHYPNWFQVTGCKSSEKSTVFTFPIDKP